MASVSNNNSAYANTNNTNNKTVDINNHNYNMNHMSSEQYTISLKKRENGGLGFLIRQREQMPYFSIWEIIKDGAADQNGKMKCGDVIVRVNNQDITSYSYEMGLDLLKSFKPGSTVELTLQPGESNELLELANYHSSGSSGHKNKSHNVGGGGNSLMSPLQKFKRKFISCTGNNGTSNSYNYAEINTMVANSTINNGSILENGNRSPIYSTSPSNNFPAITTNSVNNNNNNNSNKSNGNLNGHCSDSSQNEQHDTSNQFQNSSNKAHLKTNEQLENPKELIAIKTVTNSFIPNDNTSKNVTNVPNANETSKETSHSQININSLFKNLTIEEKNQIFEELKQSLGLGSYAIDSQKAVANHANVNSSGEFLSYNKYNEDNDQYFIDNMKSPIVSKKKYFYDNYNKNANVSVIKAGPITQQQPATAYKSSLNHYLASPLVTNKRYTTSTATNENNIQDTSALNKTISVSSSSILSNNKTTASSSPYFNKSDAKIGLIDSKLIEKTRRFTQLQIENENTNSQTSLAGIGEYQRQLRKNIVNIPINKATSQSESIKSRSLAINNESADNLNQQGNTNSNDRFRSQTLNSLNTLTKTNSNDSSQQHLNGSDLSLVKSSNNCFVKMPYGDGSTLMDSSNEVDVSSRNLSKQNEGSMVSLTNDEPNVTNQHQQQLANFNITTTNANKTKTNTIQIIQDGDDIRISIDGNIEIVTNRSIDRRIISLSPQCPRKPLNNTTQSGEQLDTKPIAAAATSEASDSDTIMNTDEKSHLKFSSSFDNDKLKQKQMSKTTASSTDQLASALSLLASSSSSAISQATTNMTAPATQPFKVNFKKKLNSVEETEPLLVSSLPASPNKLLKQKPIDKTDEVNTLNSTGNIDKEKEKLVEEIKQKVEETKLVINVSELPEKEIETNTNETTVNENIKFDQLLEPKKDATNVSEQSQAVKQDNKKQEADGVSSNNNNNNNNKLNDDNKNTETNNQKPLLNTVSQNQAESSQVNKIHKKKKGIKLKFLLDESTSLDLLHHKTEIKVACNSDRCMGSLLQATKAGTAPRPKEEILNHAIDFINQFYASVKREGSKTHKERLDEVIASINKTGTYELKETELCFGARTAWRNAPRCIGRIQWSKLQVFDARYVTTARGMFEAVCNHIKYATNKGNIRSAITIFRQRTDKKNDFRVWNPQFISYAGYKVDEQTVIGDRNNIEFTAICIKMGWKPKYTDFDVLPMVLQANGQDPELFELPPEIILELDLVHPKFDWFADLKLKWYCVPGVSSMMLDVGGLEFTACPFNGWYMGTEIGRDLADANRYNKLPLIAERMGLDIKANSSLWKDKALIELNYAIIYTFQKSTITIVDHHTASESFMKHYENENQLRGGCPADWVWVVPPLSSHLTPVFHLEMLNYSLKPSYEYQDAPWRQHVWKQKSTQNEDKPKRSKRRVYFSDIARAVKFSAKLMGKALARRVKCTILYATETGKSERFAKSLAEIFKHAFDAKTLCMKDYDVVDLEHETLLLIVTSTFGNGDPPENGEDFKKIIHDMKKDQGVLPNMSTDSHNNDTIYQNSGALTNVRFSVFGLGNSSYPKFNSFSKFLDSSLKELGADRIHELGLGDELCGQEDSFRTWSISVYKAAVEAFCIDNDSSFIDSLAKDDSSWNFQTVRLTLVDKSSMDLCEALSKLHNRKILPARLVSKYNLQHENSGRVTLSLELNTQPYSSELEYKPGDHIGILAENRKELIEAILAKVANAPPVDQLIKVEVLKEKTSVFGVSKQWVVDERYPPCTLYDALKSYLDITSPPTQNMLMYLSTQTSNENERIQLEKLAKDHLAYEEWKLNGYPNLAEVLEEFPSLRPNASLLITQLPKLQPRFYSVSSSPKVSDYITITAGVVEYKAKGNSVHYGVCTKWMDELKIGGMVPSFIRQAPNFRLPTDKTCPIIMVGAGTGIAPFRSFWQERKIDMEMMQMPKGVNGTGWGKIYLYFGCRQSNLDLLYKNELEQSLNDGVIYKLYFAFSREPNQKKVYVQDLITKNMAEVCDLIYNKQGHVYICGDVRMAAEVTSKIELSLTKQMNMSQAKQYVNEMKENNRFHEDIFGNSIQAATEKTKVSIEK